jgi:hypothetical protein
LAWAVRRSSFCGHRVAHNSIEFSLFRDRSFTAANAAMFGTVSILPIFQNGYGALGTGYLFIQRGFAARRFVPAALKTR